MSGEPGSERGSIARRAGVVAAGTLASRILGAVRDAVIAAARHLRPTVGTIAVNCDHAPDLCLREGADVGADRVSTFPRAV